MKPVYKITSDDVDVTGALKQFFVSATVVDDVKDGSDSLNLVLSNYVSLPGPGKVIAFYAGYGKVDLLGRFVTDEVEADLFSNNLFLPCKSIQAKSDMKSKRKTRSFASLKLSGLINTVANDNLLKVRFNMQEDPYLNSEHQVNETDAAFLSRMAKEYGGVFCVKNETVIFIDEPNDVFNVDLKELSAGRIRTSGVEYRSVKASYFDRDTGQERSVVFGSGTPQYFGKRGFQTKAQAMGHAKKTYQRLQTLYRGSFTFAKGNSEIYAGAKISLKGAREMFNRTYSITKVTHTVSPSNFTTSVEIG